MANFLPAGSRIAIQNVKPGNVAKWYTTVKDVELPNTCETVTCPMRADRQVHTVTISGFAMFFLPGQVRFSLTGEELARATNTRLMRLEYDIPTGTALADGHPSQWMWRYAIRTTLSCWVLPESQVNRIMEQLNNLTEAGVTWDLTKYDASESHKLIGQCVQALQREVAEAATRAEESRVRAQAALDATPVTADPNTARKAYLARAEAIQKRTDALFVELTEAAKVFGINLRHLEISRAANAVQATRVSMANQARLFVQARNALRAMGTTDGIAAANAMTAGEMPAEIAADMLQDADQTELAETVRTAFIGEPETFSLVDGI